MRGSSPRQKEQNGSSESPALAAPGSSRTNSTSQSAHRVNPCRYSALHCGQNTAPRVYYERTKPRVIHRFSLQRKLVCVANRNQPLANYFATQSESVRSEPSLVCSVKLLSTKGLSI